MLKDRDIRQRTFGFISFSFLAHLGMIAATFLLPNMIKEVGSGSQKAETYLIDTPSSIGESAQAEQQLPPAQVLTAPVDDTSAVVVEATPEPTLPEIKKEVKQVAAKKIVPAREKAAKATKKVLALPAKKATKMKTVQALPAKSVETVDQSELEVNQALQDARETEEIAATPMEPALPVVAEAVEEAGATEAAATESTEAAEATEEQAAKEEEQTQAIESATTTETEEASEAAKPVPAVQAVPVQQPLIAPIQRGAQLTRPAGQVGGLGTAGNQNGAATETTGAGASNGAVRDADSLMEQPGNAKPVYSTDDQRAGRQGTVVFDAMVTRDGSVQSIQLKQSSGSSTLDASAYEAFKKHRYLPGQEGVVRKKFQFVLNGEQNVPGRLRRR